MRYLLLLLILNFPCYSGTFTFDWHGKQYKIHRMNKQEKLVGDSFDVQRVFYDDFIIVTDGQKHQMIYFYDGRPTECSVQWETLEGQNKSYVRHYYGKNFWVYNSLLKSIHI